MAISLLAEHRPNILQHAMPSLLYHKDESVRLAAIQHTNIQQTAIAKQLTSIVQDPSQSPKMVSLALQRLGNTQICVPYLEHLDLEIRRGALLGLLQNGVSETGLAHSTLIAATQAEDDRTRQWAAEVIGEIGGVKYAKNLHLLMQDKSIGVRKAAILASGQGDDPGLWQGVVTALEAEDTRPVAIRALYAVGERALPAIVTALTSASPSVVIEFTRICGKSGGIRFSHSCTHSFTTPRSGCGRRLCAC
ncbi:MAG: hypothetical protein HC806_00645 [Anaerolineae bacterium]|nr:hypothetical protein [Anaerolineae bacterium]